MQLRVFLLLAMLASSIAINPIVIKGRKFFDSVTKNQFYVKGVDYQPSSDPILDLTGLQRDIPYMQQLGINTVRCYQTDYTQNHDAGMQLLANAGIYVLIDLSDPDYSIPSLFPSWTTTLFDFFRNKAAAFAKYPNTLGFIAANEVVLPAGSTVAAPFIKSSIRDIKAWLKSQGYNTPVGYAAADVSANDQLQAFLDCSSPAESADFYGVNIYRWCGDSNLQASGYAAIEAQWAQYSIPYIFTEFGCNAVEPRPFTEIAAIYGQMQGVLSGGLVYEWSQDVNNYGLVSISGSSVSILPGYTNLQTQLAAINPTIANMDTYTPTEGLQACPSVTSQWEAAAEPLPQIPNPLKCQCMFDQLSCRLNTDTFDPTTFSQAQSDALNAASDIVCTENPQWCWPVGVAPMYPSYGEYSDCNEFQKQSYLYNVRFLAHNSDPTTCQYSNVPTVVVTPTVPASTNCPATPNNYNFETGSSSSTTSGSFGTSTGSSSSTGSGSTSGSNGCGTGTLPCGAACYSPSQYCCANGNLQPLAQCSASSSSTSSSTSISTSTSGNSNSTASANTNQLGTSGAASSQGSTKQGGGSGTSGSLTVQAGTGNSPVATPSTSQTLVGKDQKSGQRSSLAIWSASLSLFLILLLSF